MFILIASSVISFLSAGAEAGWRFLLHCLDLCMVFIEKESLCNCKRTSPTIWFYVFNTLFQKRKPFLCYYYLWPMSSHTARSRFGVTAFHLGRKVDWGNKFSFYLFIAQRSVNLWKCVSCNVAETPHQNPILQNSHQTASRYVPAWRHRLKERKVNISEERRKKNEK